MNMDNRMDGKLTVLPSFRFNFVALSFRNRLGLPWNPWPSSRHITSLQTIWMQKSTLCTVLWMIHWHSWCIFYSQLVVVRSFKNNWHQVAPSGMAKDMHLKRLRFTYQDGFIGTCVEGTANIWYFVATEPTGGCNICYKHWSCHNLIKGSVNFI